MSKLIDVLLHWREWRTHKRLHRASGASYCRFCEIPSRLIHDDDWFW